jgi:hypothetical protein
MNLLFLKIGALDRVSQHNQNSSLSDTAANLAARTVAQAPANVNIRGMLNGAGVG